MDDENSKDGTDPFAELKLDEDFILGASNRELSSQDRIRRAVRVREIHAEQVSKMEALRKERQLHQRAAKRLPRLQSHHFSLLIVLAFVAGVIWWYDSPQDSKLSWASSESHATAVDDGNWPTHRPPLSSTPLGHPDLSMSGGSPYLFMATQEGSARPVAYDPCRPIKVVINNRTAPKNSDRIINEAIEKVSAISGLKFEIEGITDENPSDERKSFQPDRYGDRWVPILIAWTDPSEISRLDDDVAGLAGSNIVHVNKENVDVYITGQVALDGPDIKDMKLSDARTVVMHELGHLVGLGHVEDESQIMNPTGGSVTEFQQGDKAGLVSLGQGMCISEL